MRSGRWQRSNIFLTLNVRIHKIEKATESFGKYVSSSVMNFILINCIPHLCYHTVNQCVIDSNPVNIGCADGLYQQSL